MITKSIVWTRPDGGTSITYYNDSDDYNKIVSQHITSNGGTILKEVDGEIEKPANREHRDCWKLSGSKIEVDSIKVAAKLAKVADKANKRSAILVKLKITEDEAKELLETK